MSISHTLHCNLRISAVVVARRRGTLVHKNKPLYKSPKHATSPLSIYDGTSSSNQMNILDLFFVRRDFFTQKLEISKVVVAMDCEVKHSKSCYVGGSSGPSARPSNIPISNLHVNNVDWFSDRVSQQRNGPVLTQL